MTKQRLHAYLYLLIVSLIWGAAGPVIKYTLGDLPPLIFLTYRFAVSSAVALLLTGLNLSGDRMSRKVPGDLVIPWMIYGFMTSTVSLGLLFFGYDQTSAIAGTVLGAVQPLLIVAAGALVLHERITSTERIGMFLAFFGTAISIIAPFTAMTRHDITGELSGNVTILTSTLIGVFLTIWSKVLLKRESSPMFLTNLSFVIGFATITPVAIWYHGADRVVGMILSAPLPAHLGVWYMGLLSGTLAYTLWHKGLKYIEAGEAALFSYLMPVWAAPLAFFWLGERVTPGFLFGALMIAAGVVIAEYKRRQIRKRRLVEVKRGKPRR